MHNNAEKMGIPFFSFKVITILTILAFLTSSHALEFPKVEDRIPKPKAPVIFMERVGGGNYIAISGNTIFLFKEREILWQNYFGGDFVGAGFIDFPGERKLVVTTARNLFIFNLDGSLAYRTRFELIEGMDTKNNLVAISRNYPILLRIFKDITPLKIELNMTEIEELGADPEIKAPQLILWKNPDVETQEVAISENGVAGSSFLELSFLDLNGTLQWKKNIAGKIEIIKDKIIVLSQENIHAFDESGNLLWKFKGEMESPEISNISNDLAIITGLKDGKAHIINLENGEILRSFESGTFLSKPEKFKNGWLFSDFECNCVKYFNKEGNLVWRIHIPDPITLKPVYLPSYDKIAVGTDNGIYLIFFAENTAPKAFFFAPRIAYINEEVKIDGRGSYDLESDLSFKWFIDGAEIKDKEPLIFYRFNTSGIHKIMLEVIDFGNLKSTFESKIEILPGNVPPEVWARHSYLGNDEYKLEAFVKDKDKDPVLLRWDFDNDGIFEIDWGKEFSAVRKFPKNYTARILIEAKDIKGNSNSYYLEFKTKSKEEAQPNYYGRKSEVLRGGKTDFGEISPGAGKFIYPIIAFLFLLILIFFFASMRKFRKERIS